MKRWLNRPGWSSMALLLVFDCIFTSVSCSFAIWIFTCFLYPADTCHQVFICLLHFQTKVQPGAGSAPWLQGGELPHACPPCSAAQRACSGGNFGNFGNFGNAYMVFSHLWQCQLTMILTSGPELSTQRATAESSLLLPADFPFPGPRSFSEDESPETLEIIISFIITSVWRFSIFRSCCCKRAPLPRSKLRVGSSTGSIELSTWLWKVAACLLWINLNLQLTLNSFLSCGGADGVPPGADHQDHGRQHPLPYSWTRLLGRDHVHGCWSRHQYSTQTAASSGGGTKVERRREGLQYLALIQVPLQWDLLIQAWWPTKTYDQPDLLIDKAWWSTKHIDHPGVIHPSQGGRWGAGSEVGPHRNDDRHRQHDRWVLDSFHQAEPGCCHRSISKWLICGFSLFYQYSDHRIINPDLCNVSFICSVKNVWKTNGKVLGIFLSQWFCKTSHFK